MAKKLQSYDKHYFEKWYRDPAHRVSTPASARRKAALALAVAEYYLERPVRTVLDIGCGEGHWQPLLSALRPRLRYTGIDPSEYAVARYGKRRNIRLGTFTELSNLDLAPAYDLILCSNALYYIPAKDLERGLPALVSRMEGIAFLEAYASDASLSGDTKGMERRTAAFYRRLFHRHGLISCGPHCYASHVLAGCVTTLERGDGGIPKTVRKKRAF